jgi:hypothetical protein
VKSRRTLRAVAVALVALVGLSACASTPSAKRIALDSVETLDVAEPVKVCMRDAIEEYDQEQLQQIAELADAGNSEGIAELARFEASLRSCRNAT